jgi:hypothetical protein
MLFVRPMYKMALLAGVADQSMGYQSMRQTVWMSLLGTTLAVVSSTALYGSALYTGLNACLTLYVVGEEGHHYRAVANPYLNPFVFGINLNSVCNGLGVLLVCGILKKVYVNEKVLKSKYVLPLSSEAIPRSSLVSSSMPSQYAESSADRIPTFSYS